VAEPVLAHRITVKPEMWMSEITGRTVVDAVLASVAGPGPAWSPPPIARATPGPRARRDDRVAADRRSPAGTVAVRGARLDRTDLAAPRPSRDRHPVRGRDGLVDADPARPGRRRSSDAIAHPTLREGDATLARHVSTANRARPRRGGVDHGVGRDPPGRAASRRRRATTDGPPVAVDLRAIDTLGSPHDRARAGRCGVALGGVPLVDGTPRPARSSRCRCPASSTWAPRRAPTTAWSACTARPASGEGNEFAGTPRRSDPATGCDASTGRGRFAPANCR
jgi:hypothetical protein